MFIRTPVQFLESILAISADDQKVQRRFQPDTGEDDRNHRLFEGPPFRIELLDGAPTEETLAAMRGGEAPVHYLVGTPKGRLTRLEQSFVGLPSSGRIRPHVPFQILRHLPVRLIRNRLVSADIGENRPWPRSHAQPIFSSGGGATLDPDMVARSAGA